MKYTEQNIKEIPMPKGWALVRDSADRPWALLLDMDQLAAIDVEATRHIAHAAKAVANGFCSLAALIAMRNSEGSPSPWRSVAGVPVVPSECG